MLRRCENPKDKRYFRYGGRGIKVCERWHVFENFLADMKPKPDPSLSIERKDNDGNYEPDNCIWGTPEEQAGNTSRNVFYEYGAIRMTQSQWARRLNVPRKTLSHRIARMGVKDALIASGVTEL